MSNILEAFAAGLLMAVIGSMLAIGLDYQLEIEQAQTYEVAAK